MEREGMGGGEIGDAGMMVGVGGQGKDIRGGKGGGRG